MTVLKNEMKTPEVEQKHDNKGLVFATTMKVVSLYDQVKKVSPAIGSGLDMVESKIPKEWVQSVGAVGAPVIEKVDSIVETGMKKAMSLPDVRELSKITGHRLEEGFGHVKEFSATRGKDMISFDFVQYCETVLADANNAAKPYYEQVHHQILTANAKLVATAKLLQEAVAATSTQTVERVEELRQLLQVRIKELSALSVTFVQEKYAFLESKLPESVKVQLQTIENKARVAIQVISDSPKLIVSIKDKADINRSKTVAANVQSLVDAVKEVARLQPTKKIE